MSGTSRFWCHVSLLSAVSLCLTEGWFLSYPFFLRRRTLKGGCLWWTGSFLKRSITGCWMGGIGIRTSVMRWDRQEHPSPRVEMSSRGSLSRKDSVITLPSEGRICKGGEKWRDSGAERALSPLCPPDFPVRLGLFLCLQERDMHLHVGWILILTQPNSSCNVSHFVI